MIEIPALLSYAFVRERGDDETLPQMVTIATLLADAGVTLIDFGVPSGCVGVLHASRTSEYPTEGPTPRQEAFSWMSRATPSAASVARGEKPDSVEQRDGRAQQRP